MRTIKFRSKRVDNGEWVHFDCFGNSLDKIEIKLGKEIEATTEIDDETVGQFTGLHDKNGKEIYEGDLLSWFDLETNQEILPFTGVYWSERGTWDCESFILGGINEKCEVIGNIHDNKELL